MSLNLDVVYRGQVFNDTAAATTLNLDVQHKGQPYLGASGDAVAYSLNAEPGAITITGADASLLVGRVLSANAGSYAITGADATLVVGRVLNAEPGVFAVTGFDATFEKTGEEAPAAETYSGGWFDKHTPTKAQIHAERVRLGIIQAKKERKQLAAVTHLGKAEKKQADNRMRDQIARLEAEYQMLVAQMKARGEFMRGIEITIAANAQIAHERHLQEEDDLEVILLLAA